MWNFQIKKKLLAWFPEIKSFNITIVTIFSNSREKQKTIKFTNQNNS